MSSPRDHDAHEAKRPEGIREDVRESGRVDTRHDVHGPRRPDVHLNLNVRGMASSATVAINERCNALLKAGRTVYKLGLGQSPFPVPEPVVQELQNQAFQKDYLPVKGLRELRAAVADYNRRSQGLSMSAEDVLIGPGSKELMFLLQLVYYGDLVIPTPSWVSYAPQAHIIGRQVSWLRTHRDNGWRLMPDELEAVCRSDPDRPRLVVLNYPSNPTGQSYEADELEALADVAREFRVVLLSDEIYGELHHEGRHLSIARFYEEGTIVSSGLSKWCGAGGWRLGTFSFPRGLNWLLEAMAAVASETYTSTSAPIQYAAVRAFQGGSEIERYLWDSRRLLRALGDWSSQRLGQVGVQAHPPTGAFYLFMDLGEHAPALAARGVTTSTELCERLLEETGVAVLPGVVFGRPPEELTARLAYVDFDGARALGAVGQLDQDETFGEEFLRTWCPSVTSAMDALAAWLAGETAPPTAAADRP